MYAACSCQPLPAAAHYVTVGLLQDCNVQVVKGLRGGVQDVALKMLLGDTHYHVNSFRQVSQFQ